MKVLSGKMIKHTCGRKLGSVCGSRTEGMQNIKFLELTGSHIS